MKMNSSIYDGLKWVVVIFLPATAAFYLSFGNLWDFPETAKVGASITMLDTFLGALLKLSDVSYKNDPDAYLTHMGNNDDTGHPDIKLTMVKPPAEVLSKKTVNLKVGVPPSPPSQTVV